MAKDSKKPFSSISPRGPFVYPKITEPDYGSKDYPKPEGEYSVRLRLTTDEAEKFVNRKVDFNGTKTSLQELYDEALRDAERQFGELKVESRKKLKEIKPNDLYTVCYDKETEEPTGEVEFKFKRTASGVVKNGPRAGTKWTAKPDLFDAKGRKIGKGANIWGGSEGKIAFHATPYFVAGTAACGLTLRLQGVQVIELVSNGSRSADSYGFGEEAGYSYDPDDYREDEDKSDDDGDTSGGSSAGEDDF